MGPGWRGSAAIFRKRRLKDGAYNNITIIIIINTEENMIGRSTERQKGGQVSNKL